jgi:regulator of PEP synthase PpsR (kinase-PPPase family)
VQVEIQYQTKTMRRVRYPIIVGMSRFSWSKHRWPVIDVTRRSVEESAATILKLLHDRDAPQGEGDDDRDA